MVQTGKEPLDFEAAMTPEAIGGRVPELGQGFDYVRGGMYANALDRYWSSFDNVKIITYEDFAFSQSVILKEVCEFLHIDPRAAPSRSIKANVSGQRRPGFWGLLYLMSKKVGKTPVKGLIEQLAPPAFLAQLKNQVQMRGTCKQELDKRRMLTTYGRVFANDLTRLEAMLEARGLLRERLAVRGWLSKYDSSGA
jgi:hypothetical protein